MRHSHDQDNGFDIVLVEAALRFTDREQSVPELMRVLHRGEPMVEPKFNWRKPPTGSVGHTSTGQWRPWIAYESVQDWLTRYEPAGFSTLEYPTREVAMMTPEFSETKDGQRSLDHGKDGHPFARGQQMMWLLSCCVSRTSDAGQFGGRKVASIPCRGVAGNVDSPGRDSHSPARRTSVIG